MSTTFDKIYGCIAASRIASAMGFHTESMDEDKIEEKYNGRIEDFSDIPQEKVRQPGTGDYLGRPSLVKMERHSYKHEPAMTEDGIERQKTLCMAIMKKNRRITVEDWAEVIKEDVDPDKHFGYLMWTGDEYLYPLVQGKVPAVYAGIFFPWPGAHGFARSCHPIGLVNAGNPWQASRDALDVGMMMYPRYATGVYGAASYAAAIAEAAKEDSTIDSVIEAAKEYGGRSMREAIVEMMDFAKDYDDVYKLRKPLNDKYRRAPMSGEEYVAKSLVVFKMTEADPKASIIAGTNFGRDTDCTAAMAAGLSGAFSGVASIPKKWIDEVDRVTADKEFMVSNLSMKETAEGLYKALKSNIELMKNQIQSIDL